MLAATAVWGWTFVVVKDAVAAYGVIAFLALRFAIGSTCLGVPAIRHFRRRTLLVGAGIVGVLAAVLPAIRAVRLDVLRAIATE